MLCVIAHTIATEQANESKQPARVMRHKELQVDMMQDMTYVKQLENYEEEVMAKRLEEMPESERDKLMASVEAEKERRQARQQQSK